MKKTLSLLLALIMILGIGSTAIASDVSDADYYGVIRATNTGTDVTGVAANVSINTTSLINAGILNSTATNAAVRIGSTDTAFMPGYGNNPWFVWYDSIVENGNADATLYTGNVTGGKIRGFLTSLETDDHASLELSDNGSVTVSGYIDTTAGANKYIWQKEDALEVYVDNTTSGTINADLYDTANSTETLSPEGNGTTTGLSTVFGAGTHWQAVLTADNFTSYVADNDNSYDTYAIGDSSVGKGIIEQVAVYIQISSQSAVFDATGYAMIRTHSTDYSGTSHTLTSTTFTEYSDVWTTNPNTGVAWTWDEIDALEAGVKCYSLNVACYCTQVYVVVTYHKIATVSATSVSSGENDLTVSVAEPFFGIDSDSTYGLPVEDNGGDLVFNAPLWQDDCSSSPFTSIDDYGLTCTVSGAIWSSDGYYFDDTNDYIDCTTIHSFADTESWSVSAWINPINNTWNTIVGDSSTIFVTYLSGNILFYTYHAGASYGTSIGDITGTMAHITVTSDSNRVIRVYCNGEYIGSDTANNTAFAPRYIGIYGGTADPFGGTIGEVRIFDRVLTAAEILQNYNATKWKYTGDTSRMVISTLATIPDNSNPIVSCQNNSVMYLEYQEITVGGVQRQYVDHEYGLTYTDSSGNSNDATPTIRTVSSDSDVTAALISFKPLSISTVNDDTALSWPEIMESAPSAPDATFTEEARPGIFFEPIIYALSTAANVPESLFWYNFAFIFIIGIGMLVYYFVDKAKTSGNTGSSGKLFIKILVQAGLMCFFAMPGLNIYGFFVPLYYLFFSMGIFMMAKDYGW